MSVMDGLSYLNRQQVKYLASQKSQEKEPEGSEYFDSKLSRAGEVYNPFKAVDLKRNLPAIGIYCGQPLKFNFEHFKEKLLQNE